MGYFAAQQRNRNKKQEAATTTGKKIRVSLARVRGLRVLRALV